MLTTSEDLVMFAYTIVIADARIPKYGSPAKQFQIFLTVAVIFRFRQYTLPESQILSAVKRSDRMLEVYSSETLLSSTTVISVPLPSNIFIVYSKHYSMPESIRKREVSSLEVSFVSQAGTVHANPFNRLLTRIPSSELRLCIAHVYATAGNCIHPMAHNARGKAP
jgi:hypothetical protein